MTQHLDRFIEARVQSGRFDNASEVVCEGLRLLEQREQEDKAKIAWLRGAAKEAFDAIDRGGGIELKSLDKLANYVHQIGRGVSGEVAAQRKRD